MIKFPSAEEKATTSGAARDFDYSKFDKIGEDEVRLAPPFSSRAGRRLRAGIADGARWCARMTRSLHWEVRPIPKWQRE